MRYSSRDAEGRCGEVPPWPMRFPQSELRFKECSLHIRIRELNEIISEAAPHRRNLSDKKLPENSAWGPAEGMARWRVSLDKSVSVRANLGTHLQCSIGIFLSRNLGITNLESLINDVLYRTAHASSDNRFWYRGEGFYRKPKITCFYKPYGTGRACRTRKKCLLLVKTSASITGIIYFWGRLAYRMNETNQPAEVLSELELEDDIL